MKKSAKHIGKPCFFVDVQKESDNLYKKQIIVPRQEK